MVIYNHGFYLYFVVFIWPINSEDGMYTTTFSFLLPWHDRVKHDDKDYLYDHDFSLNVMFYIILFKDVSDIFHLYS